MDVEGHLLYRKGQQINPSPHRWALLALLVRRSPAQVPLEVVFEELWSGQSGNLKRLLASLISEINKHIALPGKPLIRQRSGYVFLTIDVHHPVISTPPPPAQVGACRPPNNSPPPDAECIANTSGTVRSNNPSGSFAVDFMPWHISVPPGFRPSFDNFVTCYLGTKTTPALYGGRAADTAFLNTWLDTHASPYLCLTSEAGAGKSALLVHWTHELLARQDLLVIFVPISIRFETNTAGIVFSVLASLLAKHHNEPGPDFAGNASPLVKDLCREYLSRNQIDSRQVLVVMDGIDEAADWTLGSNFFPQAPPEGVRVVVSARGTAKRLTSAHWLQTLGWNRRGLATLYELPPLTEQGIGDIVAQSGLRARAPAEALVREIYHRSGGDALLVSLYLDDLMSKPDAGSLASLINPNLPQGISGYFTAWLEEQRSGDRVTCTKKSMHAILSVLACALGPLHLDDIVAVLPSSEGLDSWAIRECLQQLGRLVQGDGVRQGLVLSHSRLANYYQEERMTARERSRWQRHFVKWGQCSLKAVRKGRLSPSSIPAYLVRFYGEHLRRGGNDLRQLSYLLSREWFEASMATDGTPAPFLRDVWHCWDAAVLGGPSALGLQARAALCLSSLASSTEKLSPDLLLGCARRGIISVTLAHVMARQKPSLEERVQCLVALSGISSNDVAAGILAEALMFARQLWDKNKRATALVQIAAQLPLDDRESLYREATELIRACHVSALANFLRDVNGKWPHDHTVALAQEAAESIAKAGTRWDAISILEDLSQWLDPHERLGSLQIALSRLDGTNWGDLTGHKAALKASLLVRLAEASSEPARTKQIQLAVELCDQMNGEWDKVYALKQIIIKGVGQTGLAKILDSVETIENRTARADFYAGVAPYVSADQKPRMYRLAFEAAQNYEDEWSKAAALKSLVASMPDEFIPDFCRSAWKISNMWARAELLTALESRLSGDERDQALREALSVCQQICDYDSRALAMARTAAVLSVERERKQVLEEAVWFAESSWPSHEQVMAFALASQYVPSHDQERLLNAAIDSALKIHNEHERVTVLLELSGLLTPNSWERILEVPRRRWAERTTLEQVRLFVDIAPALPEVLLPRAFDYAASLPLNSEYERALIFAILLSRMPSIQRVESYRKALAIIRCVPGEADAALILLEMFPLPGTFMEFLVKRLYVSVLSGLVRIRTLVRIALCSPMDQQQSFFDMALEEVRHFPMNAGGYSYGVILPHLPDAQAEAILQEALAMARKTEHPRNRAWDLGLLAGQLGGRDRVRVFDEMLDILLVLAESGVDTDVLTTVIDALPDSLLHKAWRIVSSLAECYTAPLILDRIATRWTNVQRGDISEDYQQVVETLKAFRGCRRERMLAVIGSCIPMFSKIGGERAVSHTLAAIRDTAKWWP